VAPKQRLVPISQKFTTRYAKIEAFEQSESSDPMAETCFDLIFKGEVEPGHTQDEVRSTLESLFEFDVESQVDLFSGQPVVLGKNMNDMTANLFKQALADTGIATHLLAANDTAADQDVKSRRQVHRRKSTQRRTRIRSSAILPDRRQNLDRRT
jgi:hypothetical protein